MARKNKKKVVADDNNENDDDDIETPADNDTPLVAKPRNDAFTGLLAITLLALGVAVVLLYADADSLTGQSLANPPVTLPPLGSETAAAPPG
ncbi:MAG: hypothetical protein ACRC7O_07085 [Fimbriiglobus sp.]